jgi:two-component system NtrC family sensor kinase
MIAVAGTTVLATGHLEREIARANKRHDELQTAFMRSAKLASIGELATGFAHEINNPLAIISAENTNVRDLLSEASTEDTLRNEIFESAQRCDAQVKRCSSITRKMLQFGRRTADRLETVGVTKLLEATSTLMKKRAELRNTRLRLKTVGELPPVRVVQAELEQVLVNLINNALYAIEQDGEVQIAASYEEKEVTIQVADNGHGIPAEDLERIFEPFFTTKPVGQGTGLGLSVCYGLVHEWGGKIEVESHLGQGTTFTIRLPTAVGDRSSS